VNGVFLSINSDHQMPVHLVPRIILSTLIDGLQHCDGCCINYPSLTKNKEINIVICDDCCISAIPQPTNDNRFFVDNRFFKESSEEEREHAEKLMKYQVGVTL
jgi:hypothetical protein